MKSKYVENVKEKFEMLPEDAPNDVVDFKQLIYMNDG